MQNQLTQWALKYLNMGWSIIPLSPRSKEPLIPWTEFQSRKASEAEVREWLKKWPTMNLGIVTGSISSLAVVDLDGKDGMTYMKYNKLTSPIVSITGNGRQVFYKWTERVNNSVKKIAPGVDIRGDGGYVVVSPSIHPSGRMYRWEKFVPALMVPMPMEIIGANNATPTQVVRNESGWISQALEEMKDGNRDNTLFRICSKLRNDGYTAADCSTLIGPHAERLGARDILEAKIQNVWNRYEPKQSSRFYMATNAGMSIHSPDNDDSYNQFEQLQYGLGKSGNETCTGFSTLDRYLEGGLKSERLFTVAARTGTGKTNFAIALAHALCLQGKKVLFFSTEFRYEKIWARYRAVMAQPERFREHMLYVCDSFTPRIEQVEAALSQVKPDVFIFDHINHLGEERESLGTFMQGCNFLQRKYESQGVMVAQLNRQADWVEDGKRIDPRMSMIKGSGTIEQASSRVLLLSEVKVTPEYNEIIGVLDKNDSGDRGLIHFGLYKNPYILKELV